MTKVSSQTIPIINPMYREYRLLGIGIVALLLIIALPRFAEVGFQRQMTELFTFIAMATVWNLLAGYGGMVSVGQQAWIGLGSYATIVIADDLGISLFVAVFLAGVVTAVLSLPTAWLVFRLRAGYFAIGTWVVAEVFRLVVKSNIDWLGGGNGRSVASIRDFVRASSPQTLTLTTYFVAAAIAGLCVIAVYTLMRSRWGLGLIATRDSETGAASLGINTYRVRLLSFVLAAALTGIIGGILAVTTINIRPDAAFSVQWTAFMIFMTVIGGLGTIEGPIIGALLFYFIRNYLSDFGEWSFIFLGGIAVVMMLLAPQGIWGWIQQYKHLEIFPIRRLMPARLLIDMKAKPDEVVR